ncbi:hypothetical protein [Saccharococcus thermophilus]|jgi:hypothetical protein|uniref:Uncharacterized protein n=1 Tax=Saccharococcus thermophilus TaxID=29396 RepID=A0A846MEB2_9BACL|nr:hypothetical protein [Saccharococcus thermophilus]NIK14500.1 hypothetical protein [Saccharococcus thermophilus]
MEAPFDLLAYVSLVGALLVVVKCYIGEYRKTKAFLYDVTLSYVAGKKDERYASGAMVPLCRVFVRKRRKIPIRERSRQTDEEGRRPRFSF